jgi:hypothetical protein
MSNILDKVMPKLLAQGLLALRQNAVMPRLINRSYEELAGQKGSTVSVPVPSAIAAQDVLPSNTPPITADIAPTEVQIVMDQWKEAAFYLTDKDVLESMNGVIPMQASEAIKSLANVVDSAILALGSKLYGFVGTPGVTPFGTDTSSATLARAALAKQLADPEPRFGILDPDAEGQALNLRAFQDASYRGDKDGIIKGQIGEKFGALWLMDQNVPTHVKVAAGTFLLDDTIVRPVGTKVLHMDGATVKPGVGDIFTIAGDTQTYVVVSTTNLVGTDTDVTFEPGLKVGLPAADGNEAVTFKPSFVMNMLIHRDAFALATRPLESSSLGLGLFQAAVDPVSKLALRLEISREHKRTRFSYDILYGCQCVRPQFGVIIAG